jgi:4-amino-4-deoxy-L-arabinose transferase-like glycosyltransferase
MRKFHLFLLSLIIFFGFIVRLYKFNNPIADWHSWRQVDTSSVSRMFVDNGFNLFVPTYQDVSNIASGFENPHGYRFVEFPIYNALQAGFFVAIGGLTLEGWGRLVTIIASLSTSLLLFLLVRRYLDNKTALFASFFYTFLPYSIYYGRTLLPDTTMVAASIAGVYFFDTFVRSLLKKEKKQWVFFVLSILFCAAALLLKPFAVFVLAPIAYIVVRNRVLFNWKVLVIGALSILPLVAWRLWMQNFAAGIPVSDWLLNGGNVRFQPSFFYWVFDHHIAKYILGSFGFGLIAMGLFKKAKEKDYLFSFAFLLSSLLYIFIVARGNLQHDYYQIVIIPAIAIFLGRGASFLLDFTDKTNKIIGIFALPAILFLMFFSSWYVVRDYFNINNSEIVVAGKKADSILPKDAKVIAPQDGSTVFLYYTGRQGWPAFTEPIEGLIERGATHLVIAKPTKNDFSGFGTQYKIVAQSEDYLILDLKK